MVLLSSLARGARRFLVPSFWQNRLRKEIWLPLYGFGGLLLLWWAIALVRGEMMPTPLEALVNNLDFILHPFYRRGPGDLGLGWLLLASLRRVIIGFILGALVAIPVGIWIGLSRNAWLAINPIIQILKPVSPLVWLPIALSIFNGAEPSAIFVIFITSLWSTIINTAEGVAQVPRDYLEVARMLEMPAGNNYGGLFCQRVYPTFLRDCGSAWGSLGSSLSRWKCSPGALALVFLCGTNGTASM